MRTIREHGFTFFEFILVIAFLCVLIVFFVSPPVTQGFLHGVYKDDQGAESKYILFVPHTYRSEKSYPLLVFLHGHGTGEYPTAVGLGPAIRKQEKTFPFFVLFPTIQANWTQGSSETHRVMSMIDSIGRDYRIGMSQLFLTGASGGGNGTWTFALTYPDRWAAIVPVAGTVSPDMAVQIKHIPCWCFNGALDTRTVNNARAVIAALRGAGANPKYTEVEGREHNVWSIAYENPDLYEWLLAQRRR